MSYYLADGNGFVRDFASIGGLDRLAAWSRSQDPIVQRFFDTGVTSMPKQLAEHLGRARASAATQPITLEMVEALIATCKMAEGALMIGDGTQGNDDFRTASDEPMDLVGNGSNQYVHVGGSSPQGQKPSKAAQQKALKQLSKLKSVSNNDPDWARTPFPQASDKAVEAIDKRNVGKGETRDYDPSNPNLYATQDAIEKPNVADIIKRGADYSIRNGRGERSDLPNIVHYKGKDYIYDGHHRLTAAKLTGQKVKVKFHDLR